MGRVVQATDKDRRVGPAQTKKTADEHTGGETTSEALPHAYETAMRIPARGMRVMLKLAAFGSDPNAANLSDKCHLCVTTASVPSYQFDADRNERLEGCVPSRPRCTDGVPTADVTERVPPLVKLLNLVLAAFGYSPRSFAV